jgi:hypothetical protein
VVDDWPELLGLEGELDWPGEDFSDIIGLPPPRSVEEEGELEPPFFPPEPNPAANTSGRAKPAIKRATKTPVAIWRTVDCLVIMVNLRSLQLRPTTQIKAVPQFFMRSLTNRFPQIVCDFFGKVCMARILSRSSGKSS